MKVKIGTYAYDSSHEPIMIMLTEEEKAAIAQMGDNVYLCGFPVGMSRAEIEMFMTEPCTNTIAYSKPPSRIITGPY